MPINYFPNLQNIQNNLKTKTKTKKQKNNFFIFINITYKID